MELPSGYFGHRVTLYYKHLSMGFEAVVFMGQMLFLPPNQQHQGTEGTNNLSEESNS